MNISLSPSSVEPARAFEVSLFEVFYRREYRAVVGLVYALSGSRSAAEELAQDAFVAAYRRWPIVSAYADPGAWVRNVAMNNARSAFRRRRVELVALARLGGRRVLPVELTPEATEFWRQVRKLPVQQAKAVALVYIEGRSIADVASMLGCSEGTVKTHLSRARQKLAETLKESR